MHDRGRLYRGLAARLIDALFHGHRYGKIAWLIHIRALIIKVMESITTTA